ncbi:MAG: nitroreductase, partial [Sphingobacteriales bacterium]
MNSIIESIKNRKSTYPAQFTGERIDDKVIEDLLELANWAPTHKKTEPWRFKVLCDEGLSKLFEFQLKLYETNTPLEKVSPIKQVKFKTLPQQVSHSIAICMERDEKESVPEVEEVCAMACAVQNMWLALESYGISGYWSSGGGTFTKEMHKLLNLNENQKCFGFFHLGIALP